MHFAILVEDQSGKSMLDILLPKIVGETASFEIHPYKGIGRIPKGMKPKSDPQKRILLDQLPRLLAGFGNAFAGYGEGYPAAVIVVCDLDDRNRTAFKKDLADMLARTKWAPDTRFCLAIEEGEAWLLGDIPAIKKAFPRVRDIVLNEYVNDSICGTWELLANAVYPGGARQLQSQGYRVIGAEKSNWARKICPHMDLDSNKSLSFAEFLSVLRATVVTM